MQGSDIVVPEGQPAVSGRATAQSRLTLWEQACAFKSYMSHGSTPLLQRRAWQCWHPGVLNAAAAISGRATAESGLTLCEQLWAPGSDMRPGTALSS